MLLADLYRLLEPDEVILAGDQFNMSELSDDFWAEVQDFAGMRPRDFNRPLQEKILFRRPIGHEVQK